jgi:hypothetical protein
MKRRLGGPRSALALAGTAWASAQVDTLRCKPLKVDTIIVRNTWRVRLLLASRYPYRELFLHAARAFLAIDSPPSAVPGTLTNNGVGGCFVQDLQNTPAPGFAAQSSLHNHSPDTIP